MRDPQCRLRVDVPAAPAEYDYLCSRGLLEELADLLRDIGVTRRAIVLTDDNVAPLYGRAICGALERAGLDAPLWSMPAGERMKTLATVQSAYTWLAARHTERDDAIVALGGGVVGDVAGFVAATYLRGIRLVQVPTTLVAQVDSALGGKVGVYLPEGKNLLGAFHQPALVAADPDLLATLPAREWVAGLAEVVKHGLIRAAALIRMLEQHRAAIVARDPAVVGPMVARAAAVKVAVVSDDPFERGLRRTLNYGHTLGHAIEREAGYGVVLHGEAVAWGMAAAARIARAAGHCDDRFVAAQDELLRAFGLLQPLPGLSASGLVAATRLDKKSADGRVRWVLPCDVDRVIVTAEVRPEWVDDAAEWLASGGVA